jgi:hypothetical protein
MNDMVKNVRRLIIDNKLRDEYANNASIYAEKNHSMSNVNKIIRLLDS